jgi:hypothetical protein
MADGSSYGEVKEDHNQYQAENINSVNIENMSG